MHGVMDTVKGPHTLHHREPNIEFSSLFKFLLALQQSSPAGSTRHHAI